MAIAYDNSAGSAEVDGDGVAETAAWAIAGSDRYLAAFAANGDGSPVAPSGVKWGGSGGTALTQDGTTLTIATFLRLARFGLVAPAAASQTLRADWASGQGE